VIHFTEIKAVMNETTSSASDSHPDCAIPKHPTWSREVVVDQTERAEVNVHRGGVAIAGHKGKAKVDTYGVAVSGEGGYSGAPSHFHGVVAVTETCGVAVTGNAGAAFAGKKGAANCEARSYAFALQEGFAWAGKYGVASTEGGFAQAFTLGIALAFGVEKKWSRASVADKGIAIGTPGNYVRAGSHGILIAFPPENSTTLSPKVVQVGTGGIKPNQWYLIADDLSFREVSPELGKDLDDKWKPLRENAPVKVSCAD
jgi:hypothetical protein